MPTVFDSDGLTPELWDGGTRHPNYTARDVQHLADETAQRRATGAKIALDRAVREAELGKKGKGK